RYYDAEIERFLNADSYLSTGQSFLGYNAFAYCGNNPVNRADVDGNAWETIIDILSLGVSILEVIENPNDGWAWAGLGGDLLDLIPFVTGIGETTRAISAVGEVADVVDDVHDVAKTAGIVDGAADTVKSGWRIGDDITSLTKAGSTPSWSTVRQRYWKNEAVLNAELYSSQDIKRMQAGLAPQVEYNGKLYSMELHHILPRRKGGSNEYSNLLPVTPWDHAEIDEFRHFKP
ncbi:MAG: hypothetical protein J6I64_09375, partial [Lachnospiraceae bacterium]|nr:hypothetical protein [Lachnospiraceae bacterium]